MFSPLVKYFLKRKAASADKGPSMLRGDHIMNVAIVGVNDGTANFSRIKRYASDLSKRGLRSADFFVFHPKRKLSEELNPARNETWFAKSAFNWLGRIQHEELKSSLKKEYDLLIDLSRGATLHTDVLVSKIHATWKAGEHNDERAYLLDFMVDVKGDQDIRTLIHHIDTYLFNINKPNAA